MSADVVGLILIAGAVITWPIAYLVVLNGFANFNATLKNTYTDDKPLIDGSDRALSIFIGLCAAAFWPLVLAFLPFWALTKLKLFTPAAERRRLERLASKEQEKELEQLRRKVREYEIKGGETL